MNLKALAITISIIAATNGVFCIDRDGTLDFIWVPAEGTFDHYNIYMSVDDGGFFLHGTADNESYSFDGVHGSYYRIKVTAVTAEGDEGPESPVSDYVLCQLPSTAPLPPRRIQE